MNPETDRDADYELAVSNMLLQYLQVPGKPGLLQSAMNNQHKRVIFAPAGRSVVPTLVSGRKVRATQSTILPNRKISGRV